MKKLRIISTMLIFAMMFSMIGFAEDFSEEEIASKLYDIGLVSGDGTGLNLNGELTRAEAATFIVKLMGREDTVLKSPSFYGMTPFSDVKGDEWYAPFVGYSYMNKVISGYPDNTFRADEKLTDKAFLVMVLKALRYTDDDFNWDNVFLTAYEKGIVTDLSFAVKEEQSNLDRGATLEIMYNALNLYYKDGSMTLLDNLALKDPDIMDKAEDLGLVKKDSKQTKISSAKAIAVNQVEVTLNETIKDITVNQVALNNGSTSYNISKVNLDGKVITVDVDANIIGDNYEITLVNLVDDEGFVVKSISEEVDPFEAPEVNSDYFKIKSVECESENIVHAYFTQPVNINAGLVLHYEILQNGQTVSTGTYNDMEAAVLGGVDNGVALYIKNINFQDDVLYTLKVQGSLTSAYDANLNEGEAMTMDFLGNDSSNEEIRVKSVSAVSNDTVRVRFNQNVDLATALNIANYSLRNVSKNSNSAVLSATIYNQGDNSSSVVDLKVLSMSTNSTYELTVLNARDVLKMSSVSNIKEKFVVETSTSSDVDLEYVIPISNTKLHLYFDEPLSPASVAAKIIGVDDELIVYNPNENYKLTVYLDKDEPINDDTTYLLQVTSGIVDSSGNIQSGIMKFSFKGTDEKEADIKIEDSRFISSNKVRIEFETEVSVANNASQYKLQYKNEVGHDVSITADSVSYVDPKTVIASFSNLPNESYQLVLYNMIDPSEQFTTQLITGEVTKE
ncbi:hypothetical protein EZV73_07460 [Acidaminobacter sp. JC074]|uniref:S-layer homology domain-containing protein n=1 Tax=Acidaminobacter sp. JC074 TaxID=2530199 RepID=UPI001F0CFAF1|nr:S-layer homology domain-containing protein [Acidaminobacter sp. JC074]MCH4887402.1 hypothetical protein [Acidaminobacter sp. JC074]